MMGRLGRALKSLGLALGTALFMLGAAGMIVRGIDVFAQTTPTGGNTSPVTGAGFGGGIGTFGSPVALDISSLSQPWYGTTLNSLNFGNVVVGDGSTGALLQGYTTGTFTSPSSATVSVVTLDPCSSAGKSSVPINITSATTTQLVALVVSQVIYVCGFSATIAPAAVTADTLLFEYGTGSSCGTGTTSLTGTYGNGDLTTAAPPTVVAAGNGGQTIFNTTAGNALCALSAGGAVNIQGVLTYVQQ